MLWVLTGEWMCCGWTGGGLGGLEAVWVDWRSSEGVSDLQLVPPRVFLNCGHLLAL